MTDLVHPEFRPSFSETAPESIVEIIDLLPPPRWLTTDSYPHFLPQGMLRLADIQRTHDGIDFVHVTPDGRSGSPGEFIGNMIIKSIREAGQRVGPFRKRKIREIVLMEWGE